METPLVVALVGLLGVIVGSLVTGFKEWYLHRLKSRSDVEYAAVRLICALERYASTCIEVSNDEGEFDDRGEIVVRVNAPRFSPLDLEVEWRVLPASLLYAALNFPSREEEVRALVDDAFSHSDPPDYEVGFEARQIAYAELGLVALSLAEDLRRHAGLPIRSPSKHDASCRLLAAKTRVEELRVVREARYAENSALP